MAKQSGLHQIRGKVGEHSYYRQTGVTNGLIRSINQGMSSRVKTGDEYANTRLNNAEFGQAGRIARVLGSLVTPKFRAMILPFSQAKMAKSILAAIKTDSASWGQRNVSSTGTTRVQTLVSALNSVSKGDFESFGISVSSGEFNTMIVNADANIINDKLMAIGAEGVKYNFIQANAVIGRYSIPSVDYADSYALSNISAGEFTSGGSSSKSPNFPAGPGEGTGWMSTNFLILVLMPYRTLNNTEYVLQEYCTFKAMGIPS